MVIEVIALALLVVLVLMAISIAGSVGTLTQVYQAPPLKPGDIVWIRSFGSESRCVVHEVAGNVVVVDHFPET